MPYLTLTEKKLKAQIESLNLCFVHIKSQIEAFNKEDLKLTYPMLVKVDLTERLSAEASSTGTLYSYNNEGYIYSDNMTKLEIAAYVKNRKTLSHLVTHNQRILTYCHKLEGWKHALEYLSQQLKDTHLAANKRMPSAFLKTGNFKSSVLNSIIKTEKIEDLLFELGLRINIYKKNVQPLEKEYEEKLNQHKLTTNKAFNPLPEKVSTDMPQANNMTSLNCMTRQIAERFALIKAQADFLSLQDIEIRPPKMWLAELFTDISPTDPWSTAKRRLTDEEIKKRDDFNLNSLVYTSAEHRQVEEYMKRLPDWKRELRDMMKQLNCLRNKANNRTSFLVFKGGHLKKEVLDKIISPKDITALQHSLQQKEDKYIIECAKLTAKPANTNSKLENLMLEKDKKAAELFEDAKNFSNKGW